MRVGMGWGKKEMEYEEWDICEKMIHMKAGGVCEKMIHAAQRNVFSNIYTPSFHSPLYFRVYILSLHLEILSEQLIPEKVGREAPSELEIFSEHSEKSLGFEKFFPDWVFCGNICFTSTIEEDTEV